jgi:transcriptional regulator with XRE-family HTH domain
LFGRSERKRPLERAQNQQLEDLRDDCIALFINSGLRQKDIHAAGGPTPQTISKWLYKETFLPRYDTLERFLLALGYGLTPLPLHAIEDLKKRPLHARLELSAPLIGRPRMPKKRIAR